MVFQHTPRHFQLMTWRLLSLILFMILFMVGLMFIFNIGSIMSGEGLPSSTIVVWLAITCIMFVSVSFGVSKSWKIQKSQKLKLYPGHLAITGGGQSREVSFAAISRLTVETLKDGQIGRIFIEAKGEKIILMEFEDMEKVARYLERQVKDETRIKRVTPFIYFNSPLSMFAILLVTALVFIGFTYLGVTMGVGPILWPGLMILSGATTIIWPKRPTTTGSSENRRGLGFATLLIGVVMLVIHLSEANFHMPNMAFFRTTTPFLVKVNKLYYNLYRQGLRKFQCDVKTDMLSRAKAPLAKKFKIGKNKLAALDPVFYRVTFNPNGRFDCEIQGYVDTGDAVFDGVAHKLMEKGKKTLLDLLKTWEGYTITPLFDPRSKFDIQQKGNGYEIHEEGDGFKTDFILDSQYRLGKMFGTLKNSTFSFQPEFMDTGNGLLIKTMKIDYDFADIEMNMGFQYQVLSSYQLLDKVQIKTHSEKSKDKKDQDFEFQFLNYQFD